MVDNCQRIADMLVLGVWHASHIKCGRRRSFASGMHEQALHRQA